MRWLLLLTCSSLMGNIAAIKELDQTFINHGLLGQGIIFEIMQDSIGAIKCVEGHKIYLEPERIIPSDSGLMLISDDASMILLPKIYSDQFGCYIKSYLMCASCGFSIPDGVHECQHCRSEK